ncbi:hypothetical protein [Alloyangia pacifica]|uniref:hypothetical protein n=1 Tax=Alloyangia pacifica TaxID=311180 RepID=UPI0015A052AE|nr:hypothetical protein [Alloyangia pacifica]
MRQKDSDLAFPQRPHGLILHAIEPEIESTGRGHLRRRGFFDTLHTHCGLPDRTTGDFAALGQFHGLRIFSIVNDAVLQGHSSSVRGGFLKTKQGMNYPGAQLDIKEMAWSMQRQTPYAYNVE